MNDKNKSSGNNGKLLLLVLLSAACLFIYMNNGGLTLPSLSNVSQSFTNSKVLAPSAGNSQNYTQVQTDNTIYPDKQFSHSFSGSCINGKYTVDYYYSDGSTARQDYSC